MKLCICVTGTTGSGKSTFTRALGIRGFRTVHTGDLFRSLKMTPASGESTVAPISFDDKVMGCVERTLDSVTGPIGMVAIECLPRDARQVSFLERIQDRGWFVMVVLLDADEEVRYNRVVSRNVCDPTRMEHDRAKMIEESLRFKIELSDALCHNTSGIPLLTYDTSRWDYSDVKDLSTFCDLRTMLGCAFNYWRQKSTGSDPMPDPARMASRAMDEVIEYAENGSPGELIDALWFILLALRAHGWTSETIFSKFLYKYNINEERMEKGIKPYENKLIEEEGD